MLVDPSRSNQPRPAPIPTDGGAQTTADLGLAPTGVVRRDPSAASATFRLRNGAEVELVGTLGAYSGMYPREHLRELRSAATQ